MPTLEEMRAEINRLLPTIETPQFVKNIQTAYQNMPGAAIPQAALSLGSSIIGAPLGAAYGVASNLLSDKFGTQEGIKLGQQKAGEVMNALRYTPPTKAGRDIAQAVERLPQTLTGSDGHRHVTRDLGHAPTHFPIGCASLRCSWHQHRS